MTNHIIISSTIPRIRYISNGLLATYSFPFAIFRNSDLKVYFGSEIQDSTTYSISGAGESEGGTITLFNIPESGVIITLTRELPIERTTDFQEGGVLRANTLNNELDYQIACQQQIADNLNRSMVLPPYAVDTDINLTLPIPSAGKAIVWNSTGTNLENSTVEVNALESTLKGYKIAAESAADTAATKAILASNKADIATTQAGIATAKAEEATTTLSSKANTDLDNLTTTGKGNVMALGMPDFSSGVAKTRGTIYQAEKNGWIMAAGKGTSSHPPLNLMYSFDSNEDNFFSVSGVYLNTSSSLEPRMLVPCPKGMYYLLRDTATSGEITFYPCKGEV